LVRKNLSGNYPGNPRSFFNGLLGGYFDLPHGVANAILLPHVMKYTMLADNGKYRRIAALLGEEIAGMTDFEAASLAIETVMKLSADVGIPRSLGVLGIKEDKIPNMAKDAFESTLNKLFAPRMATIKEFEELYRSAL
jgi:alcohol dehydrogenase class IV